MVMDSYSKYNYACNRRKNIYLKDQHTHFSYSKENLNIPFKSPLHNILSRLLVCLGFLE